ncbi:hypothetical protein ABZ721_40255 [Streptomyces sp. NPDC006733]|uniref:hypothetical protein n=1 Tax=Streptomyces sp. NPDC006733 TaxID=3155460 RepID=UPI0033EC5643
MHGVKAGQQDAGRVPVLNVGRRDEQVDEQAVLINQVGEQYTAETRRSIPAVHDAPHWGQATITSACTARVFAWA